MSTGNKMMNPTSHAYPAACRPEQERDVLHGTKADFITNFAQPSGQELLDINRARIGLALLHRQRICFSVLERAGHSRAVESCASGDHRKVQVFEKCCQAHWVGPWLS